MSKLKKALNKKAENYLATCFDKYEKTKIAKDSLERMTGI